MFAFKYLTTIAIPAYSPDMEPLSLSETTELEGGNSFSFGVEVEDIQANAGNDTICWFSNTDASSSEQYVSITSLQIERTTLLRVMLDENRINRLQKYIARSG